MGTRGALSAEYRLTASWLWANFSVGLQLLALKKLKQSWRWKITTTESILEDGEKRPWPQIRLLLI